MATRTAKPLRLGCISIILIAILLGMMAGLIGLTAQMPRRVYTPGQQQWLAYNSRLRVDQSPPVVNSLGYASSAVSLFDSSRRGVVPPVVPKPVAIGARESHITADINVRYKDYEGATVTAYDLRFAATYLVANPDAQQPTTLEINFPFPQTAAVLSDVTFEVDGVEPPTVTYSMEGIHWTGVIDPGQECKIDVRYRAEGVGSFGYGVPSSQRMKDFDLRVTVHGAQETKIPESALAPTERQDAADETVLSWRYLNTITNRNVQVELPARPRLGFAERVEQMGEFFVQLALAAPLLTVLFLLGWLAATRLESLSVAHEHTVLLGIGFFLFYPLFIILAGFVDLSLAFAISVVVAGALVVGYGVRLIGGRLVAIYIIPLLIVFYGLLTRGLTESHYLGMMLAISGVMLVALFMWRLSCRRPPMAASAAPVEKVEAELADEAEEAEPGEETDHESDCDADDMERYCAHCGQRIEGSFQFCPQCGQGAQVTQQCERCGLEYIPAGDKPSFCPACGNSLIVV